MPTATVCGTALYCSLVISHPESSPSLFLAGLGLKALGLGLLT